MKSQKGLEMAVLDMFSLKDRVAIVTGGAGLFGHQITEAMAEAGAKTYIASRNIEKLNEKAAEFRERGLDVRALKLDLSRTDSIRNLHDAVVETEGRVDVLVNNAVLRPMKSYNDPVDNWRQSMEVNATGLFTISRIVGNTMARAGKGSIINISSMNAFTPLTKKNFAYSMKNFKSIIHYVVFRRF